MDSLERISSIDLWIVPRLLHNLYKDLKERVYFFRWINSFIIMDLGSIIVLQPIALLTCLTGYDPLRTKRKGEKTYRENYKDYKIHLKHIFLTMDAFFDLVKDIWEFTKVRKKYWLAPLIITMVLSGVLFVFTQGSVVAPFIYSIF